MSRLRERIESMRARDLRLVAQLVAIGLLVLAFIKIGRAVTGAETHELDNRILLALRNAPDDPIGSDAFQSAVMHISALGSGAVTSLIVLIATLFFALAGHVRYALLMVACSLGTLLGMFLLKTFYERERPTIVTHIDPPGGASFPSGHSMISAALYMTLAVLIARTLDKRRLRIFVVVIGALLMMIVGLTRLYLGVHYPTDVLAGWTAGLTWALICGMLVTRLGHRGVVDMPAPKQE
ncbi:MAG: phosphatase PAP2 family protein [Myxococcota bacterium]|nr:phosphatase PAP2 family protein [Myxococcota bacterium]